MKKAILITVFGFCTSLLAQNDTVTDTRDGQQYTTVVIDSLAWFAQNLNYHSPESDCFEDKTIHCGDWGRLYNESEAYHACPEGWRLPNLKDWELLDSLDIFSLLDTAHWKNNIRHTNTTGLSLQPSGIKHKRNYWNQYLNSTIWFEDRTHPDSHWHLHVHGDNGNGNTHVFHNHEQYIAKRKFAIRCVCELDK